MKNLLNGAVKWFTSGGVKTVVDGIEVVGNYCFSYFSSYWCY